MPGEGVYTQRDPIGLVGGNPTIYGYIENPIMYIDPLGLFIVYRLLRPDENPLNGLTAKNPGRGMTVHGHVSSGSRNKGSQFISTSIDPNALAKYRSPGQTMVSFDTDNVIPDKLGNRNIIDISTKEKAMANGVGGVSAGFSEKSKEVLIEGEVPASETTVCP